MIVTDGSGAVEPAATILRVLARRATGLSGADIERLVREARQTARRERRSLTWSDLEGRLSASKPIKPESLRWRMALHEAGHAVARLALRLGTITMTTIDGPRGGMVVSEEPEPVAETESWLLSLLIAKLSGRAAEEVLLGSCIAGSGGGLESDLAAATTLALQMEVSLGFGADQPLLYMSAEEHASLLIYRPEIARRVNTRLEDAYSRARKLVGQHCDVIRALADALMAHGTLEGPMLAAILGKLRTRMALSGQDENTKTSNNDGSRQHFTFDAGGAE